MVCGPFRDVLVLVFAVEEEGGGNWSDLNGVGRTEELADKVGLGAADVHLEAGVDCLDKPERDGCKRWEFQGSFENGLNSSNKKD